MRSERFRAFGRNYRVEHPEDAFRYDVNAPVSHFLEWRTVELMHVLTALRKEGIGVCYTMDAGPAGQNNLFTRARLPG